MKRILFLLIIILSFTTLIYPSVIKENDKKAVKNYTEAYRKLFIKKTEIIYKYCKSKCGKINFKFKTIKVPSQTLRIELNRVKKNLPSLGKNIAIEEPYLYIEKSDIELPTSSGNTYLKNNKWSHQNISSVIKLHFYGKVKKVEVNARFMGECHIEYNIKTLYSGSLVDYILNGKFPISLPPGFKVSRELSTSKYIAIIPEKVKPGKLKIFAEVKNVPVLNIEVTKCDCDKCYEIASKIKKNQSFRKIKKLRAELETNGVKVVGIKFPENLTELELKPCNKNSSYYCWFNREREKVNDLISNVKLVPLIFDGNSKKASYYETKEDTFKINIKKYFTSSIDFYIGGDGDINFGAGSLIKGSAADIEITTRGGEFKKTIKVGHPSFSFKVSDSHLVEKPLYYNSGKFRGVLRYYPLPINKKIKIEVTGNGIVFPSHYKLICKKVKELAPVSQSVEFKEVSPFLYKGVCTYQIPKDEVKSIISNWSLNNYFTSFSLYPKVEVQGINLSINKKFRIKVLPPEVEKVKTVFLLGRYTSRRTDNKFVDSINIFITPDGKYSNNAVVFAGLDIKGGYKITMPATKSNNLTIKSSKGLTIYGSNIISVSPDMSEKKATVQVSYIDPNGKIISGSPAYIYVTKTYLMRTGENSYSVIAEGNSNLSDYYVSWKVYTKDYKIVKLKSDFSKEGDKSVSQIEIPENTNVYVIYAFIKHKKSDYVLLSLTNFSKSGFYSAYFIGNIEGPMLMKGGNKYIVKAKFKANLPEEFKKTLRCSWKISGTGIGITSLGKPTINSKGIGECKAEVYVEKGEARLADISVELVGK